MRQVVMRLPGILPSIALVVIGDGRGLRDATMESWFDHARDYELVTTIEVDDSHHILGFCGAIRYAWDRIGLSEQRFDFVFHLEEDWRFEREFSIAHMARVLDTEPRIAQVALRRGVEPSEAGGVVDVWPEEFTERSTGMIGLEQATRSQTWLEHRLFFTTNPCLYPRELTDWEWPLEPGCEGEFGKFLLAMHFSFAYWGDRDDDPWITHTGTYRSGRGY